MFKKCNNCEKRWQNGEDKLGCQVFKEKIEKCWAWTDNEKWEDIVNIAVKEYQMGLRLAYQREYRQKEKAL